MKTYKVRYKKNKLNEIESSFLILANNELINIYNNKDIELKEINRDESNGRQLINYIIKIPDNYVLFYISLLNNGITNFINITLEDLHKDKFPIIKKEIKKYSTSKYNFIKLSGETLNNKLINNEI